jgi:glutamate N-acetyltransferase/amino-acid N-acetyltransferase
LVTDARLGANELQEALGAAVDNTFNRISVDACESTNDSVFAVSTGAGPDVDPGAFGKALEQVCAELAEQIVRDAEGGTKFVRIEIRGAPDDATAAGLGRAVAASALWRAAAGGGDPNWGRVVSALGCADRSLAIDSLDLAIGETALLVRGEPTGDLAGAARAMAENEFRVTCVVGAGPGRAEVWSSDLTAEYVRLNAEGTA